MQDQSGYQDATREVSWEYGKTRGSEEAVSSVLVRMKKCKSEIANSPVDGNVLEAFNNI